MSFLRNKEIRNEIIVELGITAIATIGTYLWNPTCGVLILVVCTLLNGVHLANTYRRYQRIQELSSDLNRILHGDIQLAFEKYEEGELAILESEIQKMVVRLREQQGQLLADKKYLADSIADISHQIRTPLTSINLLVSFLSEPGITEEKRQKTIRELYELLSRIDWLITTLLKISKLDAGTIQLKKEDIALKELIQKSVEPLLVPIELRGQELKIEAEGQFIGDVNWTSEAIGNIVKNCMEHTPEGGVLKIQANENTLYREIVIEDTGCGIATEDLSHIFERFYKGKNSSDKSFGVGLALARGIINVQNGTVKVENKKEGGARFILRFYKELSS
jgi:signal transduction histidine kinase